MRRIPPQTIARLTTSPQVAAGITWLDDIQSFYRERAQIEKEYAVKLKQLSIKYHEKKSKKSSILSVGETPAMTPGSLERCDPHDISWETGKLTGGC